MYTRARSLSYNRIEMGGLNAKAAPCRLARLDARPFGGERKPRKVAAPRIVRNSIRFVAHKKRADESFGSDQAS
jgi:hypothetical protein